MIYANACYAPGASEPGQPAATATQAGQRAGYYSRPVLASLGASAYFATDIGAAPLVGDILANPASAYGDIYSAHLPGTMTVSQHAHPLVSGDELWLGLGSTAGSYKYAFAGDPGATFAGGSTGTAPAPTDGMTTYDPPAALVFPGGTTVGYRFDAAGQVTATRPYTLARASGASTSKRSTVIPNHPGTWYYIINGVWSGYWVAQTTDVHLAGTAPASTDGMTTYDPPAALVFPGGTTVGYRFDAAGQVTATRPYTLARASGASTSKRSTVIPNHPGTWYYIINGVWSGYWVAQTTDVHLAGTAPAPTDGMTTYDPPAALVFPGGTTVGYRFDAAGQVTATRPYTLARASGASTSKRSTVIPNHPGTWYYIINGVWSGYWVAQTTDVHLAS